jgi:hypothetical protein
MHSELSQHEYPERTVRQVAADARRALVRSGWCPERSRVDRLRCADDLPESETAYGRQLWLFEAQAVDAYQERASTWVHGAVEYSVQYGHMETVDTGIFDHGSQRDRFIAVYKGINTRPSWRWQVLRWSIVGFFALTLLSSLVAYAYACFFAS